MEEMMYDTAAVKLAAYMTEYLWVWVSVVVAHVGALVFIAMTDTKDTWYYKLVEKIALVFGKAKEKASLPPKKKTK